MPWTKLLIEKAEPLFDHDSGREVRKLNMAEALRETLAQAMERDRRLLVMGQGVDDPAGIFGITLDLHKSFGRERVFDTPLSESALTGVAMGAAMVGMRPVYLHNRPDFLLLAMDQLANHAAKWSYMFGGRLKVPLTVIAVIGRGWGSAAQHSQALHGLFMHLPGLRLVMPSSAYDAKGLLVTSIADDNPVVYLLHRWLFKHKSYVPEELYSIPFGKGVVRKAGRDVTVVAVSCMVIEALRAAEELEKEKCSIEVIDPRTLKPLDEDLILQSLEKTGRLVIADTDWKTGGAASEIAALAAEKGYRWLKAPVKRVGWPDVPVPGSYVLEEAFYPGVKEITQAVREVLK